MELMKIRDILQDYIDACIDGYIGIIKDRGFHFVMLLDILFYFKFNYHLVKHLSRDIKELTWKTNFTEHEKEWLLFYIPLFRASINKAKLEKKIEEMLDDNKCPNCFYKAVEYICEKIEEYNIHEVFKKWD